MVIVNKIIAHAIETILSARRYVNVQNVLIAK